MSKDATSPAEDAGELNVNDLETAQTDATGTEGTKKSKEPKELTPEEVAGLTAAVAKIKEFGVSENFSKVLDLVPVWHDKDASAAVKTSVIEGFGGSEAFKNYIDGDFQAELAVINGLQKAASTMNNIKSFYARRATTAKPKMIQVSIGGDLYEVNADFLASLSGMDAASKRPALLANPDTKKNEGVEVL
jgi:hypothetical protein